MITCQPEDWAERLEELKALFPVHWMEVALYKDRMPLDPQWREYDRLYRNGQLLLMTARADGRLVGYLILLLGGAMHYDSTLTAKMDAIWVAPDHRDGTAGRRLLTATRAELERRGVKLWWMGSKDHKPIGKLYEALGFEQQESYFAIWLGEDS